LFGHGVSFPRAKKIHVTPTQVPQILTHVSEFSTNMATDSRLMGGQRRVCGDVQRTAAGSRPRAADISDRIVFRIVRAFARAVERFRLSEIDKCASR
jgi:hypothetical protein